MQYADAVLSVTPPGLHFILSHSGGCARFAGLPPASVLSPTSWAQNCSGFQPDKLQFSEFLEVPHYSPFTSCGGGLGTPKQHLTRCSLGLCFTTTAGSRLRIGPYGPIATPRRDARERLYFLRRRAARAASARRLRVLVAGSGTFRPLMVMTRLPTWAPSPGAV